MGKTGREPLARVVEGLPKGTWEHGRDWRVFVGKCTKVGHFYDKRRANSHAKEINTANSASIKQAVNAKLDLLDKLFTEHRYMDTAHSGYSPERLQRAIAWKDAAEAVRKLKED